MAEAASQLDLQILVDEKESNALIPADKKKPMFRRPGTQFFLIFLILGLLSTLVRWLQQDFNPTYYPPILIVILIILVLRREQIKGIYILEEDHIKIPYSWLYRRKIPISSIISVNDDTIEDENGESYAAIRILVDSPLMKLNITGLQSPNILLSTMVFDSMDLNRFADEVTRKKRTITTSPNTLAQRLTDQVNRAWGNRWKLIIFNSLDSTSEALIYILVLDSIVFGLVGVSIWPIFGLILLGFYFSVVFFIQFFSKPQAIIGIRPHELGPVIYDEEELITSIRFIVMCKPYTVHLRDCEVVYPEDANQQVGRLNQIQPEDVPPGELTYGIAQMIGNHTKATGAVIRFTYRETEDSRDVIYEVPLQWA